MMTTQTQQTEKVINIEPKVGFRNLDELKQMPLGKPFVAYLDVPENRLTSTFLVRDNKDNPLSYINLPTSRVGAITVLARDNDIFLFDGGVPIFQPTTTTRMFREGSREYNEQNERAGKLVSDYHHGVTA